MLRLSWFTCQTLRSLAVVVGRTPLDANVRIAYKVADARRG
jgi:hypothetical protein